MDTPDRFLLGIDPGATTGLAGYVPGRGRQRGALAFVDSAGPLHVLRHLEAWAREGALLAAFVEDARGLPIYARNRRANRGERDRIARGVGHVDCLTGLYLDALAALGVPAVPVEPGRGKKWDADTLERLTGYAAPTNEHGRDAARLVFGRSAPGPTADRPPAPRPHTAATA